MTSARDQGADAPPFTTIVTTALDPKLPPFRGAPWRPAPVVTAHGGGSVVCGAVGDPKIPPYVGD
jgi:hypothetical protein